MPCNYPSPQVIAVLGMHRSGTSCLTGLLEDAGVCLGNVSKQNPYNRKGNQENLQIMYLHDAVLDDNRGSWNNPLRYPSSGVLSAKRHRPILSVNILASRAGPSKTRARCIRSQAGAKQYQNSPAWAPFGILAQSPNPCCIGTTSLGMRPWRSGPAIMRSSYCIKNGSISPSSILISNWRPTSNASPTSCKAYICPQPIAIYASLKIRFGTNSRT